MGLVEVRREIAQALLSQGFSVRRACRAAGIQRASLEAPAKTPDLEAEALRTKVKDLAQVHTRYGYRRITAVLRRQGEEVNHKRVHRWWKAEGLQVPRRRRRRRRWGPTRDLACPARRPNEVWTYDFLSERTEYGERLRILSVMDEHTREGLALRVEKHFTARDVIAVLEELVELRGAPTYIRSDNGPEFISAEVRAWWALRGTTPVYIAPGHPWENGYVESFHGKFRDECLNGEIFWSRAECQVIAEWWRRRYNTERPHSALGYLTPVEKSAATTVDNTDGLERGGE